MKHLRLMAVALLLATFIAALALPALAESSVTIPVGNFGQGLASMINSLVAVVVPLMLTVIAHRYAGTYVTGEMIKRVDQLLVPAIQSGINKAALGIPPTMTVSVNSSIVAHALEYAIKWGPSYLIKWMGGIEGIEAKIIARIKFAAGEDIPAAKLQ